MEEKNVRLYGKRKAQDHRGEGCTGVWLAVRGNQQGAEWIMACSLVSGEK